MRPDDATCATCGIGCRSTKTPAECSTCQSRRLAGPFWSPPVLTDGRWVPVGGIVKWKPSRHRQRVAACGTDAGYYRHLRRTRTEPCAPCRAAHAQAERERSERARKAVA